MDTKDLIIYVRSSKAMKNIDGGCGWTIKEAKECRKETIKRLEDYDKLLKVHERYA